MAKNTTEQAQGDTIGDDEPCSNDHSTFLPWLHVLLLLLSMLDDAGCFLDCVADHCLCSLCMMLLDQSRQVPVGGNEPCSKDHSILASLAKSLILWVSLSD